MTPIDRNVFNLPSIAVDWDDDESCAREINASLFVPTQFEKVRKISLFELSYVTFYAKFMKDVEILLRKYLKKSEHLLRQATSLCTQRIGPTGRLTIPTVSALNTTQQHIIISESFFVYI